MLCSVFDPVKWDNAYNEIQYHAQPPEAETEAKAFQLGPAVHISYVSIRWVHMLH